MPQLTRTLPRLAVAAATSCAVGVRALNNGVGRVPIMGWSSWYGYTSNINEALIMEMADAMVSTGLVNYGWRFINIDDGWAVGRDNATGAVLADPTEFPSGLGNLSDYIHARNLSFGIYTDRGTQTCLKRPGSYGYEAVDAATYAHAFRVDFVKSDSCYGVRSPDVDYAIMRDALNATGRPVVFSLCNPGFGDGEFGHMWRTGPDLYSQQWDMIVNRFQLAATPANRAATGPGAFPDPDNLEVGPSPRAPPGAGATPLEQRSQFTMWAVLPAPLVLAANLSALDPFSLATLTNAGVIAVNQDPLAAPAAPVVGDAFSATSVWAKPLSGGDVAVMLLNLGAPGPATIGFGFDAIGLPGAGGSGNGTVTVTDLWSGASTAVYGSGYAAVAQPHEAVLLRVSASASAAPASVAAAARLPSS